ncbi:hypothetical protein [Sulfurimonas sp. C5]|uniref:hypothetical protein n=1 Tax=Sulfurimonas sp. C5 TaxID=3036947 RepID=UPI00245663EF|nr:hypothetical protein [Sulfurimonas sp. C5]MDH4944689.1 hypothetical protein [Sulfurimonas sp. C5]
MKIELSAIALAANYEKKSVTHESEHLEQWIGSRNPQERREDTLQLSKKYKLLEVKKEDDDFESLDPKLQKIIKALEILTGKKIRIQLFNPQNNKQENLQSNENPRERVGWGINYSYEKTEINSQKLQFASVGNVTLEDGRKIDFGLSFSMQQSTIKHESVSFKAGDALIDPIVIQFQDGAVEFSKSKTNLDLDLDGKEEEFSFVGSGSGFLTLDKNSDGIVNDGSELFGPNSGDGFDDLKEYDQDNNSWIDENDAVFDKLRIWTKDKNGEETFYSLKNLGIGALYLENVSTAFEFDEGNMAKSSVFLRENGSAGVMSEIDLRV